MKIVGNSRHVYLHTTVPEIPIESETENTTYATTNNYLFIRNNENSGAMSFNAATLIPLKGESNLDAWARALKDEDEKRLHQWMMDRAKAMSIIHSTIRDEKVQNVLSINGWDEDNDDPKYLFDFIKNSISSVTNEAKSDVLDEY
ncbi:hypothetical protein QBC32DRAFT_320778 [Pseudoneurospora amorphoporcata]|uniref:Uncharacterized protein n=1 Tax=Pseudoneurospora amorphoporcata TaxID=241081 RepID=A0AAN6P4X3_9PEZI|nr:hypothetical protein QBC32DRAFT_320778 [Pseudoneurospora amorphoporcata]